MKKAGFKDVSYKDARVTQSNNFPKRVARGFLKPLTFLFTYMYRVTISDRNTPLSKNVILQARKL